MIGQTRSTASARLLEQKEIYPLVCDLEAEGDSQKWITAIGEADVVIDCVGGSSIQKMCGRIFEQVLISAKTNRINGPAISYIYCSGTWVHGNHLEGRSISLTCSCFPVTPSL